MRPSTFTLIWVGRIPTIYGFNRVSTLSCFLTGSGSWPVEMECGEGWKVVVSVPL